MPPFTNNPAPSTLRVRLHRARKAARTTLNLSLEELLFKLDTTEQLFTLTEQLEQLLIEAELRNN